MEILLLILVIVLATLYVWYAKIISRRNTAREALAGIDVQLTNRANVIPNILTIAKKFMQHEASLIEEVTKLRTQATGDYNQLDPKAVAEHLNASSALGSQMGKLLISMEDYPELKSDTTMVQAQKTYNEVEAQIAASRRFYNSAVADLNNSIEIFPGNLLAGLAKSQAMPFYEADEQAHQPTNAAELLE